MAVWLSFTAITTFASIIEGAVFLRWLSANLLVATWGALLIESVTGGDGIHPAAVATCLAGFLGAFNGDARLWKQIRTGADGIRSSPRFQ